jgi:hypothetical protein
MVRPVEAFKDRNIVKQSYDFSCGAASAATIFAYYLGEPVSEKKVIETMFEAGDMDKIVARKGFSLLDIKRFAESMGHRAVGYRTDLEGLVSLTNLHRRGAGARLQAFFVVFRGVLGAGPFWPIPPTATRRCPCASSSACGSPDCPVIEPLGSRTGTACGSGRRKGSCQLLGHEKEPFRDAVLFGKGASGSDC